jgi:fructose-1,6-bisphosphatase I
MAYLLETAGGRSSDGERSLLAKTPDELHERTPVHLGNAELVERVERAV